MVASKDADAMITGFTRPFNRCFDDITKVTVIPSSSNTSRARVSPSNFTFDNSTWNTAQTFTVIGVDDFIDNIGDNETKAFHSQLPVQLMSGIHYH